MKEDTMELINAYYDSWRKGISSFDENRVGGVLGEYLDFEGPKIGRAHV